MAVGYSDHIAGRVSTLLAICTRHLSRATRRLLRLRQLHHRRCYGGAAAAAEAVDDGDGDKGGGGGGVLWRRTILMGERCQPLDFAGAIHYDSSGRRVAWPRSASASSLSLSRRSSSWGSVSVANSEASASGSL